MEEDQADLATENGQPRMNQATARVPLILFAIELLLAVDMIFSSSWPGVAVTNVALANDGQLAD